MSPLTSQRHRLVLIWLCALLAANGAYLAAVESNRLLYAAQLLAHVVFGGLLTLLLALPAGRWMAQVIRRQRPLVSWLTVAAWLMLFAVAAGWVVAVSGTIAPGKRWKLTVLACHSGLSVAALAAAAWWARKPMWSWLRQVSAQQAVAGLWLACGAVYVVGWLGRSTGAVDEIANPPLPPASMEEEAGGKDSPFFPSSAETLVNGVRNAFIPPGFFTDSKTCGTDGCHPDIYRQWEDSVHHFSSFNNQWYRKTVEHLQSTVGVQPSKWCAGCHDPALLFTRSPATGKSRMDRPIAEQIDTPEAHAGIGCTGCHAIVHVKDTMGQGGFVREYTDMHALATSQQPLLRLLHDYIIRLDPAPHRRTFMKKFHTRQTAEFCSSCHKVHLDKPVNGYRYVRGFNEYDSWQMSGVSGQGARSFYYPMENGQLAPRDCSDCHMPKVRSTDQGAVGGYVHDHRFAAANTAVPFSHGRREQVRAVLGFLQRGQVSVDIIALQSPRSATELTAPLGVVTGQVRRGDAVRVEVVVRTRGVGHDFPGGTNDAYEAWLELKVTDDAGRVIFWSGELLADPSDPARDGPVEPDSHFYGTLAIDAHGNPINKRNAWSRRAVVYARTIPPGAADVAHYLVRVPEEAGNTLTITARLRYRKFSWWYTHFAFVGRPAPNAPERASIDFDDRTWLFDGDATGASAAVAGVPDPPIATMAESAVTVRVVDDDVSSIIELSRAERERFNDYGIGLLRQRDFRGAESAFLRVVSCDPEWPEGYVNVARVRLAEGDLGGAEQMLRRALERDSRLPKAHYFLGVVLQQRGLLEESLNHLRRASRAFPTDKVVNNKVGRVLYLQRRFEQAVSRFERTLAIDPENIDAHYNLMLCYRRLGRKERAAVHQRLWQRLKPNEAEDQLTGEFSRRHPEINNERQPIHDHGDDR